MKVQKIVIKMLILLIFFSSIFFSIDIFHIFDNILALNRLFSTTLFVGRMVSVTSGILETIILFETFKAIFLALFHTIQFRSRQQIDLRDWLPPPPYIQSRGGFSPLRLYNKSNLYLKQFFDRIQKLTKLRPIFFT